MLGLDRNPVRRRTVKLDRRVRRFLTGYLEVDETRKPHFYRAVEDVSKKCQPAVSAGLEDSRIAEAASQSAMKMVLDRASRIKEDDRIGISSRMPALPKRRIPPGCRNVRRRR